MSEPWKARYKIAFVAHALKRGWAKENAQDWADSIVDDAYIELSYKASPEDQAQSDVIECEVSSDDEP